MKQCPTCNRTYSDGTQSFCLDDGTPLIASYDPEATRVIDPLPHRTGAGAAPRYSASLTQSNDAQTNPALYVVIALLALLIGGGLVALFKSGTQTPTPTSTNPAATPNVAVASPRQTSTPSVETHEWTVVVPGNVRWLDTGIHAQKGTTITIQATGTVTWGPPGLAEGTNVVGPNGTRPPYEQDAALFPIPKAGIGSLVMRVGTVKYAVGADDTVNVEEPGAIEFMINDNAVGDNSGSFTVHIRSSN